MYVALSLYLPLLPTVRACLYPPSTWRCGLSLTRTAGSLRGVLGGVVDAAQQRRMPI